MELDSRRLTLLHLSDIHFLGSSDPARRRNEDVRLQLEADIKQVRTHIGACDLTVIGGDVAYGGSGDEYDEVSEWLDEICGTAGCPKPNVFTVPGNHDVDRTTLQSTMLAMHEKLRDCSVDDVAATLEGFWSEEDSNRELLFQPLANYNRFASRYRCQISASEPSWCWPRPDEPTVPFDLGAGYELELVGVNSVLASNTEDDPGDGKEPKLVIGEMQVIHPRRRGMVRALVCHHPMDWVRDADCLEAHMKRCQLHIFGHKHEFDATKVGDTVRVAAGAVHPEREGQEWSPRYNVMQLWIKEKDAEPHLAVRVYPRVWNDDETRFGGETAVDEFDYEDHCVIIPTEQRLLDKVAEGAPAPASAGSGAGDQESIADDIRTEGTTRRGVPEGEIDWRDLTYRFSELPYSIRIRIGSELGAVEEDELGGGLPDHVVFQRMLQRIHETGKASEFDRLIEERESRSR